MSAQSSDRRLPALKAQIAAAVDDWVFLHTGQSLGRDTSRQVADMLWPTIYGEAVAKAADELRSAAADWADKSKSAGYLNDDITDFLRDRADALSHLHGQETTLLDSHRGEGPCMDCGTSDTPVWSAPNDLWNRVVGSSDGYLCPWCFAVRAEQVIGQQVWDFRPRHHPNTDGESS